MKKNSISITRIIISLIILVFLLFPFESAGIVFPKLFINELIVVNVKYLIVGGLFLINSVFDFINKKKKLNDENGKMLDIISDKLLVDSILIVLASQGFIHPIMPVVIIMTDTIINLINVMIYNNGEKIFTTKVYKFKNICLNFGILFTLLYNLPFELINIKVSDILLIIATVLSAVSAFQFYNMNKDKIIKK